MIILVCYPWWVLLIIVIIIIIIHGRHGSEIHLSDREMSLTPSKHVHMCLSVDGTSGTNS